MLITREFAETIAGPEWFEPLRDACLTFEIDTPERIAAFIAQVAHESGGFRTLEENLNYSADRLLVVFPKYFNAGQAAVYARKPQKIASRVYASRMGSGDEESGDGWTYRGRGLIQLTGRWNYKRCGEALALDLLSEPELLTDPVYAALSAAWFWDDIDGNRYADSGDFEALTRKINGGTHGFADRLAWLERTREALA